MDWEQGLIAPALFIFIINTVLILSTMVLLWVISVLIKNIGIIDIFWGLGIFITSLTAFLFGPGLPKRKLMMLFLVAFWAFRLSGAILKRFFRKKIEDVRYTALRQKWGEMQILGMFLFQGVLILILSTPFLSIAFNQQPLTLLDFSGFSLSILAIFGETVADWQLSRFSQQNKGMVCNTGLWSKSRHPNYFFEWIFWIGIALFALQAPFGITGIIACALMLCIFLFFSIPLTEKELLKSRQEAYVNYQKKVPGFFPCLKS